MCGDFFSFGAASEHVARETGFCCWEIWARETLNWLVPFQRECTGSKSKGYVGDAAQGRTGSEGVRRVRP